MGHPRRLGRGLLRATTVRLARYRWMTYAVPVVEMTVLYGAWRIGIDRCLWWLSSENRGWTASAGDHGRMPAIQSPLRRSRTEERSRPIRQQLLSEVEPPRTAITADAGAPADRDGPHPSGGRQRAHQPDAAQETLTPHSPHHVRRHGFLCGVVAASGPRLAVRADLKLPTVAVITRRVACRRKSAGE